MDSLPLPLKYGMKPLTFFQENQFKKLVVFVRTCFFDHLFKFSPGSNLFLILICLFSIQVIHLLFVKQS
jgi:hypothetical protein